MSRIDDDRPDRRRKKAQQLQEKALTTETPGYAEQLIRAAEDLENYADEVEARS